MSDLLILSGKDVSSSVYKGLCALKNVDYVMIFDGARPFLTNELIEKHIQELKPKL